ncbi:hypothetical protein LCGC14_1740900 [marine sediment metagenome]|uniref:Uncharacterized protein n=1 Tax=marine sediment metagenome TaxID=412755 RepID=A0A0F9JLZ6_9ZZZZ
MPELLDKWLQTATEPKTDLLSGWLTSTEPEPIEEPEEEPVDLEVMRENQEIILKKLLDYSKAISVNQKYIRKIFEKHKELENNFKILLEKISN